MRLVVVVYRHPFMNADGTMRPRPDGWIPDPFFDPFPTQENYPGADYHAYRGPEGNTAGAWSSHVGGNLPKREAPRPREDVPPDEVHGRDGGFPPDLPRLCCCKCRYENDAGP